MIDDDDDIHRGQVSHTVSSTELSTFSKINIFMIIIQNNQHLLSWPEILHMGDSSNNILPLPENKPMVMALHHHVMN